MLLEIGLGGRLDAVNIIDADAGLITSIDIDHIEWLGADREQIGREKAGIMRPGQVAVVSDPVPPSSVQEYAQEVGARLIQLGRDFHYRKQNNSWDWWSESRAYTGLPVPALRGQFQLQNAAGVLALIESLQDILPVTQKTLHEGLQAASCPGRMMLLARHPEMILDVAHNPQSCRSFADYLAANPVEGKTLAVLGVMADKDVDQMILPFEKIVSEWFLVKPSIPRAMDLEMLREHVSTAGLHARTCDGVRAGVEMASQAAAESDRIIVFGSFFTVAEAMPETV
jgi:dihydrofolate synthase/folylpolyglutamate synthase